ncbi:UDP-N-acetylglucosamine 2-epimerase [Cellulomonas aerilata]|uniref:UDP-N-acetyl glucosamine 2-epimerase n=1 Tax=Cellulomonas aerilata TaxID=515326 RepID=A0A512DDA6_9CELL|nr:UDP-N-acetylglucosamine 2-epimerase [Cellulomonas aerilata]GEO34452.1 UDP-N-acetyl glucosamine 2-epimerase [Cellulomonas aerilata]
MIAFIVGTTAELIKIAPVFHELAGRGRPAEIWYSGQHVHELSGTLADLRLPRPERWLVPQHGARNVARPADVPRWAGRLAATVWSQRRALRERLVADGTPAIVLVHGDTFTAPIGALIGRWLGARVGHVEAGLRSGSLLHPFPEELNRRVVGRVADLHFAPTAVEARNLRRSRGAVVTTGANTVVDAVREALEHPEDTGIALPESYGVATLHRFELVRREDLYRTALETLREYSARLPIVYFAGASERERLAAYGLTELFDGERFVLAEKLSYVRFLPVLARAQFVVTDSGGLQEESAHLGIPCAVHRARTERAVGTGSTVLVTGFDTGRLREFLDDPRRHAGGSGSDDVHPSRTIVDALATLSS